MAPGLPVVEAMGYRTFTDPEGRSWEVWLVYPSAAERRRSDRRVTPSNSSYTGKERRATTRRVNPFHRESAVPPGFENGWLCFENSKGEKRRLAPVPENWETASVSQLLSWCRLAPPVG